ncbi:MAG: IS66 family insertion sequence element accessory protein TnpB [Treponemataceae bacterium]|nr:IS66 family insertion sequence element accessory protein TnpB [Treponemataceae bacterium]
MWPEVSRLRIYLRSGPTDMRKQAYSLAALVEREWEAPLFSGDLFLFCGKSKRVLKILYWDRNGFCLWTKRLERGTFPWPREQSTTEPVTLTEEELAMLLEGIDFWKRFPELQYSRLT